MDAFNQPRGRICVKDLYTIDRKDRWEYAGEKIIEVLEQAGENY